MSRLARRALLGVLASVLATACLSPTLPLPPPSRPSVEGPDQNGQVTLDGNVLSGGTVYAANLRTGEIRGQFTETDGHYRFEIPAQVGDGLELWYSLGTDQSPTIVFQVMKP